MRQSLKEKNLEILSTTDGKKNTRDWPQKSRVFQQKPRQTKSWDLKSIWRAQKTYWKSVMVWIMYCAVHWAKAGERERERAITDVRIYIPHDACTYMQTGQHVLCQITPWSLLVTQEAQSATQERAMPTQAPVKGRAHARLSLLGPRQTSNPGSWGGVRSSRPPTRLLRGGGECVPPMVSRGRAYVDLRQVANQRTWREMFLRSPDSERQVQPVWLLEGSQTSQSECKEMNYSSPSTL
jgi:hypothetical protein